MKRLTKEEKEEKKRIKKESKQIKKEEKEIVKEVKKKEPIKLNKNIIIVAVLVLLAVCLLLTSISSIVLANKLNKLESKYDELKDNNTKIMDVLNTDDGTGDKISNLSKDMDTLKKDMEAVKTSNKDLSTKVDNQNKTISSYNDKLKNIDATKLKGLYSFYDWNNSLKYSGSAYVGGMSNNTLSTNSNTFNGYYHLPKLYVCQHFALKGTPGEIRGCN